MKDLNKVHDEAMALVDVAMGARAKGRIDECICLLLRAYQMEDSVACEIKEKKDLEPTRSVILLSAATLALEVNKINEALSHVLMALSGNPPFEILADLKDCLDKVKYAFNEEKYKKSLLLPPFYYESELLDIERLKANGKEIWIVSSDLSQDTGESPWVDVIQKNIIDYGVIYCYIAPKHKNREKSINALKNVFVDNYEKCRIKELSLTDYKRLGYGDLVLYDPYDLYDDKMESFQEKYFKEYWFPLTKRTHKSIVRELSPLIAQTVMLSDL